LKIDNKNILKNDQDFKQYQQYEHSLFNSDKVLKCDTKVDDGTAQLPLSHFFPPEVH
jgi:hypothetical protein